MMLVLLLAVGHWSYPGELSRHLQGPPHYVNVAGMSHEQMLTLHDRLHEQAKVKAKRKLVRRRR
jgi:hypothetical protein